MIGLGKWTGAVNTMFFSGDLTFYIKDEGGKYVFDFDLPEGVKDIPDYELAEIEEDGDTLSTSVKISMLPGKKIDISLTFNGDTMNGLVKIPFIGKVKLENFKKIG